MRATPDQLGRHCQTGGCQNALSISLCARAPLFPRGCSRPSISALRRKYSSAWKGASPNRTIPRWLIASLWRRSLWKDHYLAALRLDQGKLNIQAVNDARKRWRQQVLSDPTVLFFRLGPEIPCELPSAKVRIVALGEEATVRFDINTVRSGVMRLIPGISEAEIGAWLVARTVRPFEGRGDFHARGGLKPASLALQVSLRFL